MIDFNQFLKNPEDVLSFKHSYGVFKKCNKSREVLNKTLETRYKAVYRLDGKNPWKQDDVDWDGELFYIVTSKGKILEHTNSEWGGIGIAKPWN